MQSFNDLSLNAALTKAIADLGFETPSPIQAETLPILLGSRTDFLGLASTGSGKTAAYGIPLLEKIDPTIKAVQAVVLCPTRELALQVQGQINLLGKYLGVKAVAIYGGSSYGDQIRGLKAGAQVMVGTPGRVVDHIGRGTLQLENVKTVVLDEADEMISMGFKEDLEAVLGAIDRENSNIWLFSATMSASVRKVAHDYLVDPAKVEINRTEVLPSTIEQIYFMVKESDKMEILTKLIDNAQDFYGLIFCQTKDLVVNLAHFLSENGYKVDSLHGDKSQDARERTMRSFRDRKVKILVCTDVASRGLDVKDITHVINYSLPRELDNYVHRIGRTARSGKTGIAMSLVTPSHLRLVEALEKRTKTRMTRGRIPNRKDIGAKKLTQFLGKFQEQSEFTKAVGLLGEEWKTALAAMTAEEIAGRFLTMMVPDLLVEEKPERPAFERPFRPSPGPNRSFGGGGGGGKRAGHSGGNRPYGKRFEDRPERTERPPVRAEYRGPARPAERPSAMERAEKGSSERTERPAKAAAERPAPVGKRTERPLRDERPVRTERQVPVQRTNQRPERVERPHVVDREPRVADGDRPHVPFYEKRDRSGGGRAFGGPKAKARPDSFKSKGAGGFRPPKRPGAGASSKPKE